MFGKLTLEDQEGIDQTKRELFDKPHKLKFVRPEIKANQDDNIQEVREGTHFLYKPSERNPLENSLEKGYYADCLFKKKEGFMSARGFKRVLNLFTIGVGCLYLAIGSSMVIPPTYDYCKSLFNNQNNRNSASIVTSPVYAESLDSKQERNFDYDEDVNVSKSNLEVENFASQNKVDVIGQSEDAFLANTWLLEDSKKDLSVDLKLDSYIEHKVKRGENLYNIIKSEGDKGLTTHEVHEFNKRLNPCKGTDLLAIDNISFKDGVIVNEPDGIVGDKIYPGQIIFIPKKVDVSFTLEDIAYNDKGFIVEKGQEVFGENGKQITVLDYVFNHIKDKKDIKGAVRNVKIRDENGISLYNDEKFIGTITGVKGVNLESITNDSLNINGSSLNLGSLLNNSFVENYFTNNRFVVDSNSFVDDFKDIVNTYNTEGIKSLRILKNKGIKKEDVYSALDLARSSGINVRGSLSYIRQTQDYNNILRETYLAYMGNKNKDALKIINEKYNMDVSEGTMYRMLDLYAEQNNFGRIRKGCSSCKSNYGSYGSNSCQYSNAA